MAIQVVMAARHLDRRGYGCGYRDGGIDVYTEVEGTRSVQLVHATKEMKERVPAARHASNMRSA